MSDLDVSQFYEVPPLKVRLVGGPSDGTEFYVSPETPTSVLRIHASERATAFEDEPGPYPTLEVLLYEFHGSIGDDGLRRYLFIGHTS